MNDDGICCGHCNDRWRRAQAAYHQALAAYGPLDSSQSRPDPPQIRPMDGHPWCLECQAVIRRQFSQLDRLASLRASILVDLADGYPSDASPQRVSGSREPPSPSPQADDVADTADVLAEWEFTYRRQNGWMSAERYGNLADQRTECLAWLGERLDAILSSPMAADFGREVMEHHADLCAKTKAGVRTLRKPLRCPASMGGCGLLMLMLTDGDKNVRCCNPACNLILPLENYYATVDAVAAGIRKGAAKVPPRTGAPLSADTAGTGGRQ